MVEIGNWDVFILTFEETFYGYLINRTKIVKIFHKSAKMSNMSNSPESAKFDLFTPIAGTVLTKFIIKIKNQWWKGFRKSSRDKWLEFQTFF